MDQFSIWGNLTILKVKTLNMNPAVNHPRLGTLNVVGQAVKLDRTPQKCVVLRPT